MNIGDLVKSPIYPEKGLGKIVELLALNENNYYEIYFSKTKETLTLEAKDVQKLTTPLEKLKSNEFDDPVLFKLRILAETIDYLLHQNKIVTANNFKIVPLPHQILVVNHVLEGFKPRCLIADEVGLGKTIEAALIFEELKLRNIVKRVLIVSPAGLTTQWKDELKTKFNEDFMVVDRNSFKALKEMHGSSNVWEQHDRIITSLDFLKPKLIKDSLSERQRKRREEHNNFVTKNCANAQWDMVIFDEAHKLSKDAEGRETSRYKVGKALSETAPVFLLLTATPHQGDGEKFRHLLGLIDEYMFYSAESITPENVKSVSVKSKKRAATDFEGNLIFKSRLPSLVKIERDKDDVEVQLYNEVTKYVSEYYNLASRENNFIFMFLLIIYQRMVSSSSKAIYHSLNKRLKLLLTLESQKPEKSKERENFEELNAQEAYDELIKPEEDLKEDMREDDSKKVNVAFLPAMVKKEIQIIEKCVQLAKKASFGRMDYKVRKTVEILNEVIKRENDKEAKFLIFTEFIATQYYLGKILENLDYKVAYLNGKMSLDEKIEAKVKFKETHQILISTDAGGEGINLQFCHIIINYDLPWNPMKIEQRIGRLDRIGQEKDVFVFNFILKDTIEERVREILDEKLDRIATQFGDDKKADILDLLQEEFDFDKIFINALKQQQNKIPELEKIGEEIFNRANKILEKQDLLIPFSDKIDNKELKESMIENEAKLVKPLIQTYAKQNGIKLNEYSKKKGVFYSDKPLNGKNLSNAVFDKAKALDSEGYEYLNITHPITRKITEELIQKESLTFNIEIENTGFSSKGFLFYYRVDLTNNEGFMQRHLIPIFIDEKNIHQEKISNWFGSSKEYVLKAGLMNEIGIKPEEAIKQAETILNQKLKNEFGSTKLELLKKIEEEQTKFARYFEDKEKAIKKIAIPNIKEAKLMELGQQRVKEKIRLEKRKNLVPVIKLFAVARIRLR